MSGLADRFGVMRPDGYVAPPDDALKAATDRLEKWPDSSGADDHGRGAAMGMRGNFHDHMAADHSKKSERDNGPRSAAHTAAAVAHQDAARAYHSGSADAGSKGVKANALSDRAEALG